jgi:hypothetical protein
MKIEKEEKTEKIDTSNMGYLISHIVKHISLPEFIEDETGEAITWTRTELSGKCCCPLHNETLPSFHIDLKDDVWFFHCFGCGDGGTIINFCKSYHELPTKKDAIFYLCNKYKIKNTSELILEGIKNLHIKTDIKRKIENENIVSSNQCRRLMQKDFNKNKDWVMEAYKKLNQGMEDNDSEIIRKVGQDALNRLMS